MTLQSENLVMVGLGNLNDTPSNELQSPLVDGIHLRWAFKRNLGFPWYGYYLYRRRHRQGNLCSLQKLTSGLGPGPMSDNVFNLSGGYQVQSDKILHLTDDFPPGGDGKPEFDLESRKSLCIIFPNNQTVRRVDISIGFRQDARIEVFALVSGIPVTKALALGNSGDVVTVSLEFDAISSVSIGSGPAALVDLCFVFVSDEATKGWELLPGFSYPLHLPVLHPDYPCTLGTNEDMEAARTLAGGRILYGRANDFVHSRCRQGQGTIAVANGSSIVKGTGTAWKEEQVGALLRVVGDSTAYTVIKVTSDNKLALSREYAGISQTNAAYQACQDMFGQLHDQLVHLVTVGPAHPVDMAFRTIPISIEDSGTVSINTGSKLVTGTGTNWNSDLVGLNLQVSTDEAFYTITSVKSNTQVMLDRAYSGEKISSSNYQIFAALMPSGAQEEVPSMPEQRPLDYILLGALNPAMAQMVGLYWVDQTAEQDAAYDYLIVADDTGYFYDASTNTFDPERIFSDLEEGTFPNLDGYIVFNKKVEIADPLDPPENPKAYSLPGGFMYSPKQGILDAQNNAGLRWDLGTQGSIVLPGRAIMYHVWRAALGQQEPANAPAAGQYDPITKEQPVLISGLSDTADNPQRSPDWPSFPMYFIDSGLDDFIADGQGYGLNDGWYSYQINGIDIFGRHSKNSLPAPWYQWTPVCDPRPWYYQNPEGDRAIKPFAIHLLDKIPPPPPAGIEAHALDPADPTLVQDQAYTNWRASLSPADKSKVGLRVSWLWTPAHAQHAQDLREFRVYYQPGHMNAMPGSIVSVSISGKMERTVETDIKNTHPADAYKGTTLNIGADSFPILGSEVGSPLRVRVEIKPTHSSGTSAVDGGSTTVKMSGANLSKDQVGKTLKVGDDKFAYTILDVDPASQTLILDRAYEDPKASGKLYTISGKLPFADKPCNIVIPSFYSAGKISVTGGSTVVTGSDTAWNKKLVGSTFKILGESATYSIAKVNSQSQLTLKKTYSGPNRHNTAYAILHPISLDFTLTANWERRIHVTGHDENVTNSLRVAQNSGGDELKGDQAKVAGKSVTLNGKPDLSGVTFEAGSPYAAYLYLQDDTNRSTKLYRITGINNTAKTVSIDGLPTIGGTTSKWAIGLPVRKYEIFLLAPNDKQFTPSQKNPIVYANIGVSAVDDKQHTLDNPKWVGDTWGDRYGNQGRVGGLVTIVRVQRILPKSPEPPRDSEKVYASLPDYRNQAYYTYRWKPEEYLKTHIFRALDDSLFKVDWKTRSQNKALLLDPNKPKHLKFFPNDWNVNKHQPIADELKSFVLSGAAAVVAGDVVTLDGSPDLTKVKARRDFIWLKADTESQEKCYSIIDLDANAHTVTVGGKPKLSANASAWAIPLYETLPNDALRVLAGLPGNDQAFTQLTIQPLDPKDSDTANRRGPDDPDVFQLDTANAPLTNKTLRAYIATLDGRSTNRYFFRCAYVDGAHNRSEDLSISSPPVYLRNVLPPRAPVFTRVLAGDIENPTHSQDCRITLYWALNREADMTEYLIYRTDNPSQARDIRLMDKVQSVAAPTGPNPLPEMTWLDDTVQGLVTYSYRLVAVDNKGNVSAPSVEIKARAFDETLPVTPPLVAKWVNMGGVAHAQLNWTGVGETLVQRRTGSVGFWTILKDWFPPGTHTLLDADAESTQSHQYRLRACKSTGAMSIGKATTLASQD